MFSFLPSLKLRLYLPTIPARPLLVSFPRLECAKQRICPLRRGELLILLPACGCHKRLVVAPVMLDYSMPRFSFLLDPLCSNGASIRGRPQSECTYRSARTPPVQQPHFPIIAGAPTIHSHMQFVLSNGSSYYLLTHGLGYRAAWRVHRRS